MEGLKLNARFLKRTLSSRQVEAELMRIARSTASRAPGATVRRIEDAPGDGYVLPRARVRVYGNLRTEADTGYLSRALRKE